MNKIIIPTVAVLGKKKIEKIEKNEKQDGRKNNGGARNESGRKPLVGKEELKNIQQMIEDHGLEEVPVQVAGQLQKKSRILILLEKLFERGAVGDVKAAKEYLDRNLGKSKETINLGGRMTIEDAMAENARKRREELGQKDEI